jgi:uncharacterized protein YkwD
MRSPARIVGIALTFAALVAGSTATSSAAIGSSSPRVNPTLARELRQAINDVRTSHHLRRLAGSTQLAAAARRHAVAMGRLGFFSHSSADGSSSGTRITSFYPVAGARAWAVGEVLLWGDQGLSASQALATWLASAPHRTQILSGRWREMGIATVEVDNASGVFVGRDVTLVVADFGTRRR